MWRRQRRLWWTSGGGTPLITPHWPSTARLWRESAALNSWGCTSRRISPGPPTPCHSPRRHNSAYTFSAGWKEQVSHHPSSPHSTGAPLRVCWPAASLSGTGTAVLLTARPSSGQWTRLQRSSVPLSHPSWTFSLHDAPAKPTASWRTPPHPSHSLFQLLPSGRRYRSIRARSARLLNSFFPQAVRALNSDHPTPLWNPMQTPTSWNMDPPPTLPPLPHQRKKMNFFFFFFVQFKCATHRWVGPYKPPVLTHSPLCTRHFSYTAMCTQSHKRLRNICMFTCSCTTTNHLVLFPSQLLDSQCFSLHMYSIYVKHSHSLYFLSLVV